MLFSLIFVREQSNTLTMASNDADDNKNDFNADDNKDDFKMKGSVGGDKNANTAGA